MLPSYQISVSYRRGSISRHKSHGEPRLTLTAGRSAGHTAGCSAKCRAQAQNALACNGAPGSKARGKDRIGRDAEDSRRFEAHGRSLKLQPTCDFEKRLRVFQRKTFQRYGSYALLSLRVANARVARHENLPKRHTHASSRACVLRYVVSAGYRCAVTRRIL
jgi:hypothetical protein